MPIKGVGTWRWVAFEYHDEVLRPFDFDEGHVLFGGKPTVGQHIAVAQRVLLAHPQHLAQVFVFSDGA
jgi:hypothetical protein